MSFETALYSKLSSGLSTTVSTRIYPATAPQGVAKPYIVYRKVSANRQYAHSGQSSLTFDRVQVSVFSTEYLVAKGLVSTLFTTMEGWTGVQAAFKVNEIDFYEEDTKLYHIPVDFMIWHNL